MSDSSCYIPKYYFTFHFWRIGFCWSSDWSVLNFDDRSVWVKVILGFYWRAPNE